MNRSVLVFILHNAAVVLLCVASTLIQAETYQYDDVGRLIQVTYDDGSQPDILYLRQCR